MRTSVSLANGSGGGVWIRCCRLWAYRVTTYSTLQLKMVAEVGVTPTIEPKRIPALWAPIASSGLFPQLKWKPQRESHSQSSVWETDVLAITLWGHKWCPMPVTLRRLRVESPLSWLLDESDLNWRAIPVMLRLSLAWQASESAVPLMTQIGTPTRFCTEDLGLGNPRFIYLHYGSIIFLLLVCEVSFLNT